MKYFYPNYFYKKKTLKFINKILNFRGNFFLKKEFFRKKKEIDKIQFKIDKDEGYRFINEENFLPSELISRLETSTFL